MSIEGMRRCLAVEGSTTAAFFEAYIERVLAPNLRSGQVVVMDNLAAHKSQRIKELIEERGCELVYLTPYSPDFNPIEEAFSKVKRLLGETEARTRKGLIEAIGCGDLCGYGSGRSRLLRALRVSYPRSTTMTSAVIIERRLKGRYATRLKVNSSPMLGPFQGALPL